MKRFLFQLIIVFVIFSVSDSVMGQSFPFQTSPTGSYVPAPHIFQDPSTLIQKMGMHYSACELKMRASSKLGSITFTTSSTSSLNAGSVVNVYLDNSQYCDLRTWRSWTDVNDSIDASGQAQLVIINATNFRLVFSSALANSFVYEGGGLDVFVEGLGQVSTETLSGFESAGNVGFWGLNLPVFGTNVIRPVMGGNYALTTQNIPPTCIRTVTCSNQTQYCPGEIVCMYLKKQDGVFVNDGGLSFSWERTTTPCDAASWTSVPASSSWSLQLAAPSLSGTYYYRCKITDGASLYYSSLSGTCSAAGCNDYFSITVIPALNTLGCYDEPDIESISLGARISEVEMKVNGALLLKSNTNFVNGICTTGADFYSVYARPNSGSSLTSIIEAPIISPTISWMDFSDALSSTVVPEVHPGDLIDFKVRMSNCDKPQLFNHAVRLEFDWDNNQTFETLYDFSFLEATPILSYYQGFPESLLLNPIEADSVVYQKSFIVPCDIVCGSNVVTKFRVSLKRLPTGWGDAEDYAIKSLCNDVTINFSGSNTICQGQSKLLSVGVGSTFQWNKDGVPITGATNSTFSANQSGAYTVTVQIAGCTYTSGVVHIILDNVSVNAGSDFTKTCVTNPSGSAVGESSSSGFTYAWSPSAGLSSAAISNPVANPSSTTTYTLTKTNSTTGCSSSDQVLVTVNTTLPTVNAGSDFTKTCVTNPSGSAVGESSSSGFTYAWSPSSGLSSAAISNPVANPSTTTTYTLTKTNSTTGCSSSDQVLVTVDATLPTVNAGLDQNVCAGDMVTLSGSGALTYSWNNGVLDGLSFTPIASNNYIVIGEAANGCQNSDTVAVSVTQPNTYYLDVDGDGFGSISLLLCVNPGSGYVAINGDCDDSQANIFPLQIESCNAIDDNCNGVVDEGCALGIALSTAQLTSTPQYGMPGTNFTHITDMTSTVDYPESNTGVHEKWFKFMALSNAIRIEVVGATSNDDNAIRLFSDPGLIYTSPLVPIVEENDVNNTSVGVLDQGNEVLLTDLLTEGQWYYVCVTTLAGTPGSITTKFNALLPSTCDVMPFTAYTGIYTNNCQTFKCQYRTQARRAIIHRWSSGVQVGSPLSSYTIPAPTSLITTCQLSKITPVNMTGSPQTIFISADLEYNLLDAAGNMNILFANQTSNCNFQLNSESTSNVRSTDECPVYKNYTSSVATDRSICGAMQYQWEFTMVYPSPALPVSVNGASNSRILPLSTVPGMANGQRYDVRIRSLYSDATTYSNWSSASECIRTMGAAGLTPLESVDDFDLKNANGSVFPNPTRVNSRAILNWQYENVNVIEIYNLQGQCVEKYDAALVQNKSMELKAIYAGGLYHIVLKGPQIMYCIPWMVE